MRKSFVHAIVALIFFIRPYFAMADAQTIPAGTTWKSASPDVLGKTDTQFPKSDWWQAFHDAPLSALIQTALAENPNVQAAKTQIEAAEAMSRSYRSTLMPELEFDPGYSYNIYGLNEFIYPIGQQRDFQAFQLPLNATYDVDLFGKNFAKYQSSKMQIDVARYQYEAAQIELAGMVATVYFNISKWRRLEELAREQLEASRKLMKHSKGLLEFGQATIFDIQNEQQQLDQAQVNVTQYSANRQVAENQMLALLGESPNTQTLPPITPWEKLQWPAILDIGVPSGLVVHRPDVAIAEAQLAAAHFDIQAARRAFLPTLILNGSTGYSSVGIKSLFFGTSIASFLIATFSQIVFDGGRRRAELDLRKAYYRQLLENYRNTLINAFSDAENSLAVLRADQIIYRNLTRQTEAAREKSQENLAEYKQGLEGEPPWLAAEVERLNYEKMLTQQKVQMLIDVVSVAKAMGGGFETPQPRVSTK